MSLQPTSTTRAQRPDPVEPVAPDSPETGEVGSEGGSPGDLVQPAPANRSGAGEGGMQASSGRAVLLAWGLGLPLAVIVLWFATSMVGC